MEEQMILARGSGRGWLQVRGLWSGPDLTVTLSGGSHPHIGAVALAQPRPSLRGDGSRSATVSVLTLPGHLEDEVARWAAHLLAVRAGGTVVVTAGMHVDQATPAEITALVAEAKALVTAWADRFLTPTAEPTE